MVDHRVLEVCIEDYLMGAFQLSMHDAMPHVTAIKKLFDPIVQAAQEAESELTNHYWEVSRLEDELREANEALQEAESLVRKLRKESTK